MRGWPHTHALELGRRTVSVRANQDEAVDRFVHIVLLYWGRVVVSVAVIVAIIGFCELYCNNLVHNVLRHRKR